MSKIGGRSTADAIIKAVEERVMSRLGSYARLDYRFGVVAATNVPSAGFCSVYLNNDTSYASPGFKYPAAMSIAAGYRVRVAIDPLGDRWVADVMSYT